MNPLDLERLSQALALAEQAVGLSDPNPRVGCVIGSPSGQVFGTGFTQAVGQAHAEVVALRAAQSAGAPLQGAIAWVTLEPCAHHGRTPPCCDALVAAGLSRVVVAIRDPFPEVDGRGIDRLRAAGIEVTLACDLTDPETRKLVAAAREINVGFFSRIERGRPWVRLKIAASLDGRTGLSNGASQWITGPAARADGHAWRRRAGAVLTGLGTVLADDPRLDVREVPTTTQPLRAVADTRARMPASAKLLRPPGRALVYTGRDADTHALEQAGAEVVRVADPGGRLALREVIADFARRQVNEVHVEAGPRLSGALVRDGLADELLLYLAPCLLGPGREMVSWPALADLNDRTRLSRLDVQPIGEDLRLRALFVRT